MPHEARQAPRSFAWLLRQPGMDTHGPPRYKRATCPQPVVAQSWSGIG